MSSEHQTTRRVAVEPMRKPGLARQAEAQGVKIILEARAAFRPGMNGDAGGLIENEHQPVAIEEARSCFFRRHGEKWYGSIGRPGIGRREGFVSLEENDENKGNPACMRRWFRGAEAAIAPVDAPPPRGCERKPSRRLSRRGPCLERGRGASARRS